MCSVAAAVVLILVYLQPSGFGQKVNPTVLQQTYEEAQRAFLVGDLGSARRALNELLKARSDIPEAYNLLGVVYARQGNSDKAVANFKKAATLRPGYSEAVDNLSLHLIRSGQTKQAVDELQALLRLDPTSTEIHTWLGRLYFQTGEFNNAVSHLERAKTPSGERNAEIDTMLGSSYLQLGDERIALEAILRRRSCRLKRMKSQERRGCAWEFFLLAREIKRRRSKPSSERLQSSLRVSKLSWASRTRILVLVSSGNV